MAQRDYEFEDLLDAYHAITEDNMSITTASKRFGVPRSTLDDRVKGRVNNLIFKF